MTMCMSSPKIPDPPEPPPPPPPPPNPVAKAPVVGDEARKKTNPNVGSKRGFQSLRILFGLPGSTSAGKSNPIKLDQ